MHDEDWVDDVITLDMLVDSSYVLVMYTRVLSIADHSVSPFSLLQHSKSACPFPDWHQCPIVNQTHKERRQLSRTRVCIATGLGIAVGDLLHTVLGVIRISAVVMASAILLSIVKHLGAAYLIYLGIRAILEKVESDYLDNSQILTTTVAF